jgi:hypothetical protein
MTKCRYKRTSISEVDAVGNWEHETFVCAYAVGIPAVRKITIRILGI